MDLLLNRISLRLLLQLDLLILILVTLIQLYMEILLYLMQQKQEQLSLADIFTGNLISNVAFGYNTKIQSISSNSYTLNLNLNMEEFRVYAIAQIQHSEISSKKKCKRHLGVMLSNSNCWFNGRLDHSQQELLGFTDLVQNYSLYGFQLRMIAFTTQQII
ncbi:unnamed protein product [Paramecium primaurelia]|uniref:Transmembrane protein n=1 Tax=Paramecium primaurelia TaxID=5886 RepID=A0A8S1NFM7_PARPR|nr:unnamed protein product [Paramecium primaurelia]